MRVVMLSLHTSPLAQPGAGDAGGLNVYVRQLAQHLTGSGIRVQVITTAPGDDVEPAPGFTVKHWDLPKSPPGRPWRKEDLPMLLPGLVRDMAKISRSGADLIHSHYWSSGLAGLELAAFWNVPLVHSMHTLAVTKNRHLSAEQQPEPQERIDGERRIAKSADRIVASTAAEAAELEHCYGALAQRVSVVPPGVDLGVFHPRQKPQPPSAALTPAGLHLVFAGRLQHLKGPHVLLAAANHLINTRPEIRLRLTILGSPSGPGGYELPELSQRLGLDHCVNFLPPVPPEELAEQFRAADAVVMPSSSESFGLVALEAQACGTPVLATRVGGLREAVREGITGILVDGVNPQTWAEAIGRLYDLGPAGRERMGRAGARHAAEYSWTRTAERTAEVYHQTLR